MKKVIDKIGHSALVIVALLLMVAFGYSSAVFSSTSTTEVICPAKLICYKQSCQPFPKGFFYNQGRIPPDGTYYLYQVTAAPNGPACFYRSNPNPRYPYVVIDAYGLYPDVYAPNNRWDQTHEWCVSSNPDECKFYKYN